MKIIKVEEWEQNHINNLTLKLIFAATVATLGATGLSVFLRGVGLPEVKPELLFAPWSIALVIGTAISFHAGVMAERSRMTKPAEKAEKEE
jgi:hypothetical protein